MPRQLGRSGVRKSSRIAAKSKTSTEIAAATTATTAKPKPTPPTCEWCRTTFKGPFASRPAACKRVFLNIHREHEAEVKAACRLALRQNACRHEKRDDSELYMQIYTLFCSDFVQNCEWRAQDHERYDDSDCFTLEFHNYQDLVDDGKIDTQTFSLPRPPPGAADYHYLYGQLNLGPQTPFTYFGPFEDPAHARDANGQPVEIRISTPPDAKRPPSHLTIRMISNEFIVLKMATSAAFCNKSQSGVVDQQDHFEFWGCGIDFETQLRVMPELSRDQAALDCFIYDIEGEDEVPLEERKRALQRYRIRYEVGEDEEFGPGSLFQTELFEPIGRPVGRFST